MHTGFNNLPVSCTTVDTSNGVPGNLPLDVNPEVQQFAGPAITMFVEELQANAYRNPLRTFTYNYLSRNRWNNDDFLQAFTSLLEYLELKVFGNGLNPQQVIPDVSKEMASILTSIYALKFPELSSSLNPAQQQEIQALNNRFKDISESVNKYMHHKQSSQQWNNQPSQNNWGRGNPQQNWNQYPQGNQWGGQPNMPPAQNGWPQQANQYYPNMTPAPQPWGGQPNMMPPAPAWGGQPNMWPHQQQQPWGGQQGNQWGGNTPVGTHHNSALFANRNRSHAGGDSSGGMFHDPNQGNQWNANPQQSSNTRGSKLKPRNRVILEEFDSEEGYTDYRNTNQKTKDTFRRAWNNSGTQTTVAEETNRRRSTMWDPTAYGVSNNASMDYVDKSKNGYDVTGRESMLVLASKSGKVKTFTKDQPYSVVYNPKTHVLFHRIYNVNTDFEVVVEVLKTMEEAVDMGYDDHELNVRFKQQVPVREDKKVVPSWETVTRLKETPSVEEVEKLSDEDKKAFEDLNDPLVIPQTFTAYSHQHASVLNELFLNKNDLFKAKRIKDLPFEYRYYKVKPFFSVDSVELTEKVAILGTLSDIDVYAQTLDSLYEQLPADLWVYLNQKATEGVNRVLRAGMGFNVDIDNFVSDWSSLQEYFVSTYGNEQGGGYIDIIKQKCTDAIINGGLKVLVGSELEEYLNTLDKDLNKETLKEHGVVLGELFNVTVVPWTTGDLDIDISRNTGNIKESVTPELYKAVKSIMDRVSKSTHKSQRVLIKTQDQTVLEISKGVLGPNHYMLSDTKIVD